MNKELERVFQEAGYEFRSGMKVYFLTLKKELKEGLISALFLTNKPPSVSVQLNNDFIVIPTKKLLFVGKDIVFRNNKNKRSRGVIREIRTKETIPIAKICSDFTEDDRCLIIPIKDIVI